MGWHGYFDGYFHPWHGYFHLFAHQVMHHQFINQHNQDSINLIRDLGGPWATTSTSGMWPSEMLHRCLDRVFAEFLQRHLINISTEVWTCQLDSWIVEGRNEEMTILDSSHLWKRLVKRHSYLRSFLAYWQELTYIRWISPVVASSECSAYLSMNIAWYPWYGNHKKRVLWEHLFAKMVTTCDHKIQA